MSLQKKKRTPRNPVRPKSAFCRHCPLITSNETDPIVVPPNSNTPLSPANSGQHTTPGRKATGGSHDPARRSRETDGEELQESPYLSIRRPSEQPDEVHHSEEIARVLDKQPGPSGSSRGPGGLHNIPSGTPEAQVVADPVVPRSDDLSGGSGSHKGGNGIRQYISLATSESILKPSSLPCQMTTRQAGTNPETIRRTTSVSRCGKASQQCGTL